LICHEIGPSAFSSEREANGTVPEVFASASGCAGECTTNGSVQASSLRSAYLLGGPTLEQIDLLGRENDQASEHGRRSRRGSLSEIRSVGGSQNAVAEKRWRGTRTKVGTEITGTFKRLSLCDLNQSVTHAEAGNHVASGGWRLGSRRM
jgi:hypothetical protein